jgi:hypothetical protein
MPKASKKKQTVKPKKIISKKPEAPVREAVEEEEENEEKIATGIIAVSEEDTEDAAEALSPDTLEALLDDEGDADSEDEYSADMDTEEEEEW